ncbi:hypothetical protein EDD16DRAFT_450213 [Pisolithus croceorrhizus]|nr:hypothetical protein EDD16DRAFT_450213 [Pisolithus croceorrhizus]KAI6164447.1 hypothetical protein EDD17DRAFT_1560322 [Pisolithus thermaeus]
MLPTGFALTPASITTYVGAMLIQLMGMLACTSYDLITHRLFGLLSSPSADRCQKSECPIQSILQCVINHTFAGLSTLHLL